MEFIPKKEIIEAKQWFPGNDERVIECTKDGETFGLLKEPRFHHERADYRSIEWQQIVESGDYIETEADGRLRIHTQLEFHAAFVARVP